MHFISENELEFQGYSLCLSCSSFIFLNIRAFRSSICSVKLECPEGKKGMEVVSIICEYD